MLNPILLLSQSRVTIPEFSQCMNRADSKTTLSMKIDRR